MSTEALEHSRWERWLSFFAKLRPGEGRAVLYFMSYGFLVMFSYYMLKTLREPMLLSQASAEAKSYASAAIAVVLLFAVPAYGALYRWLPNRQLNVWIGGILLFVQTIFFYLSLINFNIGFAYYVWIGVFGVLITAQFWAFAADCFNVNTGQRLFPLIMVGASFGGLFGPALAGQLFQTQGAGELMLIIMAILVLMLPMTIKSRDAVPVLSRGIQAVSRPPPGSLPGGFSLVFKNHYLMLIALLIVLLNWVNTTGEYILAELVLTHVDGLIAEDPSLDKGHLISSFYGKFYSIVNLLSFAIQMLVVSRVIDRIGVQGALLVAPVIVIAGYGVMAFIPIFSIIQVVKIMEDSTDYSLMNTTRHSLFLPLSAAEKYQSKITIDGFFWRFGDLVQAAAIYIGLNLLGFEAQQFAIMNMILAMLWLALAMQIGRHYTRLKNQAAMEESDP